MTKKERAERLTWIASLKKGDVVATYTMEHGKRREERYPSSATVEAVAEQGCSVLVRGGGSRSARWTGPCGISNADRCSAAWGIFPVTETERRIWKSQAVMDRLRLATGWNNNILSVDQLLRIGAILDETPAAQ